jgi:putative transposase
MRGAVEAPMAERYDEFVPALKKLLPARSLGVLARAISFIRRLREVRASVFVWAVVLSRFGHGRPGFEQARQWYRRLSGKTLAPRPFHLRFKSPVTVTLFEQAFERAVRPWREHPPKPKHHLGRWFPDVVAWDSTPIQVADALRRFYKGTRHMKAALKAVLAVSVFGLRPLFARVEPGNAQDMALFPPWDIFQTGTLFLLDKGFASYRRLNELMDSGHHFVCPMRLDGNPIVLKAHRAPRHVRKALRRQPKGVPLRNLLKKDKRIAGSWDLDVRLIPWGQNQTSAKRHWIHARLVILPGPERKQRPYLTSLSPSAWTPTALRELYRLRWQVELVFKELKQHLSLEAMPTKNRYAVKVFVWASLIALALARTVASVARPNPDVVGLANPTRLMLLTRALRANARLLGRILVAPVQEACALVRLLLEELRQEGRPANVEREDTFQRLVPLLALRGTA